MMNNDFLLDWQNIEYALNESELIALSELNTGGNLLRLGTVGKMAVAPAYIAATGTVNATKAIGNATVNSLKGVRDNGLQDKLGLGRATGAVMRSPLMGAGFWQRLKQKLKEIWMKFKNMMSALFRTNEGFVNKELANAEAIIKNAIAQDSVDYYNKDKKGRAKEDRSGQQSSLQDLVFKELYPYWKTDQLINQVQIPPLNIRNQNMMDSLSDPTLFASTFIRGLRGVRCEVEQLKTMFRGGEAVSVSLYDLVPYIKVLVNHCSSKNETNNQIKQEERALINAAEEAERALLQSGIANEATTSDQFDNNVNNIKAEQVSDTVVKIRNYISVCKCITGAKETIIVERYNQAINVLRTALQKCRPATKEQIQNTETEYNTEVTKESSNNKEPKKYANNFIGRMQNRHDTLKKISGEDAEEKGELSVNQKYLDSLPSDMKKLTKKAEKMTQQRDEILNFIKLKKINQTDPRFQPLWDQAQEYEKSLAVINRRMRDIEKK